MDPFPVDLPPTMLRSTLYTNMLIGNVYVSGNITSNILYAQNIYGNLTSNSWYPANVTDLNVDGNVTAGYFIGNGALLSGITASTLPSIANIDITGNVSAPGNVDVAGQVNALGNVVGQYFLGNGALLSGITASSLPATANIDIIGNVSAPGNVVVAGQVNVLGNVVGQYFIGNGSQLTDVAPQYTANGQTITTSNLVFVTDQYLSVTPSNSTSLSLTAVGVNTPGNLVALSNTGFIPQETLNGYLMIPQGYVANTQVRLEISGGQAPIGTFVTQVDTGNSYILTTLPSNIDANWITFTGTNFPVNTVFGRNGDVLANYGDYYDSFIELSANVGTTPSGNSVAEALKTIQFTKANIIGGNISADYFIGNGALLTGVTSTLPSTASIDITGNVSAPGNVDVAGQVTTVGNVIAGYFLGNGALLTGISASTLPATANIDITGNVSAPGNVVVAGQVNVTGNVVGQYFLGNGALLTGITSFTLPATANIDITQGNLRGAWANVFTANAFEAFIGNVVIVDGIVSAPAGITTNGNVAGQYFIGNGSQLSGVLTALPAFANIDIRGNVTGNTISTETITASANLTVAGSTTVSGNVTSGGYFVGNGYYLTLNGLTLIPQGNVANAAVRLALTVPPGSLITQTDINTQYLLTTLPANANTSWLEFTGTNFPVPSVFGRTGAITASPNDYNDSFIQLSANVGTATTTDHVSDALAYLNTQKANIVNGNVNASFFIGDVRGNIIGTFANVSTLVATNANVTTLIGETGNIVTLLSTQGNVGNTRFLGGNVAVSGQINTLGNVVAPFFLGNGSQLTGVISTATSVVNGNSNVTTVNNGNIFMSVTGVSNVVTVTSNAIIVAGNIFNSSGLVYNVPSSYARYVRSNIQTMTAAASNVIFTTAESTFGTDITANTSTGVFTLAPGKTYRVRGSIGFYASGSTSAAFYRWYNVTTASYIGSSTQMESTNNNTSSSGLGGTAEAIISPGVTTQIVLRAQGGAGFNAGVAASDVQGALYPWADIEVIASQAPITTIPQIANVGNIGGVALENGNIFNFAGQLYNVPASYVRYVRTATQTVTGSVTSNIVLTSVESSFGSDITGNTTTGVFTLAAGKTYRLRGNPGFFIPAVTSYLSWRWFNVTTSTFIGSSAQAESLNNNFVGAAMGGDAEAVITPGVTTQVVLQVVPNTTATLGVSSVLATGGALYPWAEIEVIGGQSPLTSISQIANNLTANTLFVTNDVVGNLAMASNVRIFSQQMPFMWNPAVFASPIVTGNNIIVATAQGANGTYDSSQNGWRLTNLSNQYSSLAWNTGFDFRRDFRVDTGMYFTSFGGGNWISVGGSTNGGTSTPNAVNNGALTVSINYASGTGITYLNTATLSSNPYHMTALSATWYSLSMTVQTVAGKRLLTAYLNNGPVQTSADVTTWVPTGSFLVIGGNTAASTNAQYLNNVRLSYL
jgi:cytoskeletal protein CcmA (bactofilin family)